MVSKNTTAKNKISIHSDSIFPQRMAFTVDNLVAIATNEIDVWSSHRLANVFDRPFNADPITIRITAIVEFVDVHESRIKNHWRADSDCHRIDINLWNVSHNRKLTLLSGQRFITSAKQENDGDVNEHARNCYFIHLFRCKILISSDVEMPQWGDVDSLQPQIVAIATNQSVLRIACISFPAIRI